MTSGEDARLEAREAQLYRMLGLHRDDGPESPGTRLEHPDTLDYDLAELEELPVEDL